MSETNLCAPVFPPPVRMPLVAIEKLSQHGRYHHGNSTGEEETWGGRPRQKVQSFTERWLLTAGPGSALDPDRSWNSLRLFSCSVTLISQPQSSLLLFFLSLITTQNTSHYFNSLSSVQTLCHVSHRCVWILWLTLVEIVWLCDVRSFFTEYFPVWHFWKLVSNLRGVSPASFSFRLAKAMSLSRSLWAPSRSLFKMSPNSVTFLYGHYQMDVGGSSFVWVVSVLSDWHEAISNVPDHLQAQQPPAVLSSLLTTSFLQLVCLLELLWRGIIQWWVEIWALFLALNLHKCSWWIL